MAVLHCVGGLDGATAQRAMAVRPPGARWTGRHDAPGIAALVVRLQAVQPTRMGRAAPGGSQRAVGAARAASAAPPWEG